jgi:hypothetical protein
MTYDIEVEIGVEAVDNYSTSANDVYSEWLVGFKERTRKMTVEPRTYFMYLYT